MLQEGIKGFCAVCGLDLPTDHSASKAFPLCRQSCRKRCYGHTWSYCITCDATVGFWQLLCSDCGGKIESGLQKPKGWPEFQGKKFCLGTASHGMIQKWMEVSHAIFPQYPLPGSLCLSRHKRRCSRSQSIGCQLSMLTSSLEHDPGGPPIRQTSCPCKAFGSSQSVTVSPRSSK